MKKNKSFDLKPFLVVVGLLLLIFVFYIASSMQSTDRRPIPLSVIALLAGVFYESRHVFEKWSTIFWFALGSFALSFTAFLPGKHETYYRFENHIQMWPYSFLFFFVIFAVSFNKDKTIARLTEGITLIQSIAVVYWVMELHFYETNNTFVKVLMAIGLLFSGFSFFNAFTNYTLSKSNRLTLSIWSCIIMVLFAADNIYRTYQNEDIEVVNNISQGLFIGLQFFLLGVCSIYIAQNLFMLIMFLPSKSRFFNKEYFKDLKELKADHIKRYSDRQVNIFHSLICLLVVGGFFYFNYHYQILPRNMAILIVFVVFPILIDFFVIATKQHIQNRL